MILTYPFRLLYCTAHDRSISLTLRTWTMLDEQQLPCSCQIFSGTESTLKDQNAEHFHPIYLIRYSKSVHFQVFDNSYVCLLTVDWLFWTYQKLPCKHVGVAKTGPFSLVLSLWDLSLSNWEFGYLQRFSLHGHAYRTGGIQSSMCQRKCIEGSPLPGFPLKFRSETDGCLLLVPVDRERDGRHRHGDTSERHRGHVGRRGGAHEAAARWHWRCEYSRYGVLEVGIWLGDNGWVMLAEKGPLNTLEPLYIFFIEF